MTDIRDRLLAKFKELGVSSVWIEYAGYGDSGQLESIGTTPKLHMDDIEFDSVSYPWRPDVPVKRSLKAALEDFVWDEITSRYGGFENNDGGQGELTWDINSNQITLDHSWNIMETEDAPTVVF